MIKDRGEVFGERAVWIGRLGLIGAGLLALSGIALVLITWRLLEQFGR